MICPQQKQDTTTTVEPISSQTEVYSLKKEHTDGKALNDVIRIVSEDKTRIWNSIEVFKEYVDHFGTDLTRRRLVSELERHFKGELLVFSSPGVACILTFRGCATHKLNVIKDEDDNIVQGAKEIISRHIANECKQMDTKKSYYHAEINKVLID